MCPEGLQVIAVSQAYSVVQPVNWIVGCTNAPLVPFIAARAVVGRRMMGLAVSKNGVLFELIRSVPYLKHPLTTPVFLSVSFCLSVCLSVCLSLARSLARSLAPRAENVHQFTADYVAEEHNSTPCLIRKVTCDSHMRIFTQFAPIFPATSDSTVSQQIDWLSKLHISWSFQILIHQ